MYRKTQQKLDRAALLTRENLEGIRVVRAFSRQQQQVDEFNQAVDDIAVSSIAVGKLSAILNPVSFMVMNLGIVAIIYMVRGNTHRYGQHDAGRADGFHQLHDADTACACGSGKSDCYLHKGSCLRKQNKRGI